MDVMRADCVIRLICRHRRPPYRCRDRPRGGLQHREVRPEPRAHTAPTLDRKQMALAPRYPLHPHSGGFRRASAKHRHGYSG